MNLKKLIATMLTVTTVFSCSITGLAIDTEEVQPTTEITKTGMERMTVTGERNRWYLIESESNDTMATADNTGTVCAMNGVISSATDVDWFVLPSPHAGLWWIDLMGASSSDLDLEIYDQNGRLLGASRNANTSNEYIDYTSTSNTAKVYIKVYFYSGRGNTPYTLSTTYKSGIWQ